MSYFVVFRQRPHFTEKYENAAFSQLLSLPFTVIRHENGAILERWTSRRILKTPGLCFNVDENILTSLTEFTSNANPNEW